MRIDSGLAEHQGRLMKKVDDQADLIEGLQGRVEALEGEIEPIQDLL